MSVSERYIKQFEKIGALWIHDGNKARPHAKLTTGLHSNGFFNGGIVAQHTRLFEHVVADLIKENPDVVKLKPTWVIGPAMGAITLAYAVSANLLLHDVETMNGWATKVDIDGNKHFDLDRIPILNENDRVLLVEDTITTGGSTGLVADAIEACKAEVVGYMCVFNRSTLKEFRGLPIRSLIHEVLPIWEPHDCELCAIGSRAMPAKKNWDALTKVY